jgi:competence protein ComEC
MRHVSGLLTLGLIAGIAAGVVLDLPLALGMSLVVSAAWVALVLAVRRQHRPTLLGAAAVLTALCGWMLGVHAVDRALQSPLRTFLEQRYAGFALTDGTRRLEEPVTIEGILLADAALTESGAVARISVVRVFINGAAENASGGISVGVSGASSAEAIAEWRAGRLVRAPILLRRPARYLNDGLPDQERALARRGISLVGTLKSTALLEVIQPGRFWEEWAAAARDLTRRALARHLADGGPHANAIATAILIGDRAGLSADTERRLQDAGTYHVIAISGGNIAIVSAVMVASLALFGIRGRAAALCVIGCLTAYGIIAAGGVSVARATLMAVVYFGVRLIDQRTPPANAVAISASAMLVANPLAVVDVGFWFTFGATVALLTAATLSPVALATAPPRGARAYVVGLRRAAYLVLVGSVCVEIAITPINAFVFQRVTVAGLVLNFAALPAMSLVQISAMAIVGADAIGADTVATIAAHGATLGARILVDGTHLLDYAPWLTWRVPSPAPIVLTLFYTCIVACLLGRRAIGTYAQRGGLAAATVGAMLLGWIVVAPPARTRALGDGRLHLTMLDVGQGDSLLVVFPNGRTLLVDCGGMGRGTFDIGDRVVGPALRARQLLRLDYVAITHADLDHAGGAPTLVRDFQPREVWWGIPVANHEPTEAVRRAATRVRAGWRTLQRGDSIVIGGVQVRLHHPGVADWERQRIRNNDSLVFELRWQHVSLLLTGDIGHEVESELIPLLELPPLVVLKVAHHGSLSSSTPPFLGRVRPSVALIGAGRGNTYGHPAPLVLGRLHDAGAEVFRTDLDGQVTLTTDGQTVWARSYTGRRYRVSVTSR